MPQYVIEREIPGAGNLTDAELQAIARKSVGVLKELGPEIKWLHSYVTGDKVYCVYLAPDPRILCQLMCQARWPSTGGRSGKAPTVKAVIIPDSASVAPIDRSMPRVTMTSIIPTESMPSMAVFVKRSLMFSSVRKLGLHSCTTTESRIINPSSPSSRNLAILMPLPRRSQCFVSHPYVSPHVCLFGRFLSSCCRFCYHRCFENCFFRYIPVIHDSGNASFAHYDHPVAHANNLWHLRGYHDPLRSPGSPNR